MCADATAVDEKKNQKQNQKKKMKLTVEFVTVEMRWL
jgi:hypothetical protein